MFYQPVMAKRFFRIGVKYNQIDWRDFRVVVENFKQRMEDWYLKPGAALKRQSWDNSFALMAINCLLIDALSQYEGGYPKSSETQFKVFVTKRLPELAASLPTPIRKPNGNELHTFADVLYVGFRCGIVHEAHISMFGGVAGLNGKLCDIDTDVCTKYEDGTTCPTVRIDPTAIFTEVRKVFHTYILDLTNEDKKYNQLRGKFKKKFRFSFGIDLKDAKL